MTWSFRRARASASCRRTELSRCRNGARLRESRQQARRHLPRPAGVAPIEADRLAPSKERKPLPTVMETREPFETAAGKAYLSRAGGPNSGAGQQTVSRSSSRTARSQATSRSQVPEAAATAYSDAGDPQDAGIDHASRAEVPVEGATRPAAVQGLDELSGFKTVRTLVPPDRRHADSTATTRRHRRAQPYV